MGSKFSSHISSICSMTWGNDITTLQCFAESDPQPGDLKWLAAQFTCHTSRQDHCLPNRNDIVPLFKSCLWCVQKVMLLCFLSCILSCRLLDRYLQSKGSSALINKKIQRQGFINMMLGKLSR